MRPPFSPLVLIYLAAFVNIVSFTMIFPLLPAYAQDFQASNITIGILVSSFALAQFLTSPLWGRISDKFGRKPIIAIGLLGLAGSFLLFGLAWNLTLLFLGRILQGVFSAASLPAARAFIADITTKEERTRAMGHLGAALALGIIIGPAIGGLLAQYGIAMPFFAAAAVALLNLLFVLIFLPESLKEKMAEPINLLRNLTLSFQRVWTGMGSALAPLFLLAFVWSFSLSNNNVVVPLLGAEKFALNTREIGILFTVMGVGWAAAQLLLLSPLISKIGERRTIMAGLLFMALGFALMPFLPPHFLFLHAAILIAGIGSAISRPTIMALISKETQEQQGITMGVATSYEALGRLVGPLIGGYLFSLSFASPFLFSGAVAAVIIAFVFAKTPFLSKA